MRQAYAPHHPTCKLTPPYHHNSDEELPKYIDHFGEERRLTVDFMGEDTGMCDDLAPVCADDDDKCITYGQTIYKKMTKTETGGLYSGASLNHHMIQHKMPTEKVASMSMRAHALADAYAHLC